MAVFINGKGLFFDLLKNLGPSRRTGRPTGWDKPWKGLGSSYQNIKGCQSSVLARFLLFRKPAKTKPTWGKKIIIMTFLPQVGFYKMGKTSF